MSVEALKRARAALVQSKHALEVLWVSHHANRTDYAIDEIDATLATIDDTIKAAERSSTRTLLTAAVDAAMVEMRNIDPPLRRSECERLITAALSGYPKPTVGITPAQIEAAANTAAVAIGNDFTPGFWTDDMDRRAAEHIKTAMLSSHRPTPLTLPPGDVSYFNGDGDVLDGYTADMVLDILRSCGINAQRNGEQ